jgi:hypothetical protein
MQFREMILDDTKIHCVSKMRRLLMFKQLVRIVTTALLRINKHFCRIPN